MDFYYKQNKNDDWEYAGVYFEFFNELAMTSLGKKVRRLNFWIDIVEGHQSSFDKFRQFVLGFKESAPLFIRVDNKEHVVLLEYAIVNWSTPIFPYNNNKDLLKLNAYRSDLGNGDIRIFLQGLLEKSIK